MRPPSLWVEFGLPIARERSILLEATMFSTIHPQGGVKLGGIGCVSSVHFRRQNVASCRSRAPTLFATTPLRTSRRDVAVGCATGGQASYDDARVKALVKEEMLKQNDQNGAAGVVAPPEKAKAASSGTGVFWLCLANAAMFLCQTLNFGFVKELYLYHAFPQWWQFLTCSFCHASWQHLSSNIFMLYIFGKAVEEEGGSLGVVMTYLVCAIGGAVAGYFALPRHSVSLGASAAVFGLFVVSVLTKLTWSAKKLLEAGILGQFVIQQLVGEIKMQAAGGAWVGGNQISHVAHLGGAAAGVLLVLLLSRLPE
ncbi:hypothetical protein BSKO_05159 [Bryopsis sp. KO-2023]|nr:hypothetical protein BSKO_05159 [Bryopsis sp. KO-2023]